MHRFSLVQIAAFLVNVPKIAVLASDALLASKRLVGGDSLPVHRLGLVKIAARLVDNPEVAGRHIAGVYERSITTPTGKLAVIRRQDTFTLAPWRPGLEPFKGRAVTGMIGPNRVTWALDRGRALPARS